MAVSSRRKKNPSLVKWVAGKKAGFWIDIAIRVVLSVYFAFSAGAYFRAAFGMLRRTENLQSTIAQAVDVFSILSVGFFAFFVAYLYAIRLRPKSKFAGLIPAVTAILGAFMMYSLFWLEPRNDLPIDVKIFANCLVLVGETFSLIALRDLGQSFSILPEGRALVRTGPYRYIRHPVYLGEAFATLGAMINFLSPIAVALVITQLLMQLGRIHYEEKVLRETFPEYVKYSRHTYRLIPGIY